MLHIALKSGGPTSFQSITRTVGDFHGRVRTAGLYTAVNEYNPVYNVMVSVWELKEAVSNGYTEEAGYQLVYSALHTVDALSLGRSGAGAVTSSMRMARPMHAMSPGGGGTNGSSGTSGGGSSGGGGGGSSGAQAWLAIDDGIVLVPGKNYDLVPTAVPDVSNPQWLQIHQDHVHAGAQPHTHRPVVQRGPDGRGRTERVDNPTTAEDIGEAHRRIVDGELRERRNRRDRGGP